MKINCQILGCILLALSMAAIGALSVKIRGQDGAVARLRRDRDRLQRLTPENAGIRSIAIDPAEMDRLRRETAVLLKLRNEFGKLTQSNAHDTAQPTSTDDSLQKLLDEREEILGEEKQIHQLSDRAACIKNLEQIASAKIQWAKDNTAEKGFPVVIENLVDYLPQQSTPICPAGGHYSVNRIGASPACSIEGHSIP